MYALSTVAGVDVELSLYAIVASVVIGLVLVGMILYTRAKLVNTAECEIRINEDDTMTLRVPGGGTLLQTLTSKNIAVPSPCGGKATCKQCRVKITDGVSEPIGADTSTFSRKDLKAGWRLSCQTKIKQNIHVEIDKHLLSIKSWDATVTSNDNVATFIKELVCEAPEEIPYRSGGYLQFHVVPFKTNTNDWKATMHEQYFDDWNKFGLFNKEVDFSNLPPDVIRAYSMASYPAEKTKIKFNIRIATPPFVGGKLAENTPWGICSSYAFSLKPGDKLRVSGPYGESFMKNDNRDLYFLIGGAGSSFGRSHVLHLFNTEHTKRHVEMWYGARSLKENIYQAEYEELDKKHDNFSYHLVLSDPLPDDFKGGWPKNDPLKTNYLFRAFEFARLKNMEEPEEALYYVCGPPLHNQSVLKLLDDYGVPRENIVLDDFGS